jgi:succinyl-CoA synthetase alpha subunit
MGHAGAVVSGSSGSADAKLAALEAAGVRLSPGPHAMGKTMYELLHHAHPHKARRAEAEQVATEAA